MDFWHARGEVAKRDFLQGILPAILLFMLFCIEIQVWIMIVIILRISVQYIQLKAGDIWEIKQQLLSERVLPD